MSDTPRTDQMEQHAYWFDDDMTPVCESRFVRPLEMELIAAQQRIKRLEESENRMLNWLTEDCPEAVKKQLSNAWMKSKEAKP